MLVNLWVKDNYNGCVHQVGTDQHDGLELIDGKVEYVNIQSMNGTHGGDYEFIESPDVDGYVGITPEILYVNREMIHKDLLRELDKETATQSVKNGD